MRSRGFCSHFRSVAGVFAIVVAGLTGAVIGGDQFDREDRRSGVTAGSTAVATPSRAVLQDGSDWLSEGFWQRKRRQQLGSGGSEFGYFSPQFNPFGEADQGARRWERRSVQQQDQGLYRTVCVRLCDGYYFPVSFSTLPTHFGRDNDACQSKCAAPTELYFHQNPGGSVDQMVSQRTQQPYTTLRTAFRYRKEFVQGCSCKRSEYVPQDGASAAATPVPPTTSSVTPNNNLSPVR